MEGEYSIRLVNAHEQLLQCNYFTVEAILTPPECWVSIDLNGNREQETAKKAKMKDLTNVVVKANEKPVGFINTQDLEEKNWSALVKIDKFQVPTTEHLSDVVSRMAEDARKISRERSPLYFAYDEHNREKGPIGIFTFWDLNRNPSYTMSYLGLQYLEQTLLHKIRDQHTVWSDHHFVLEKICKTNLNSAGKRRIKESFGGRSFNLESLSYWGLEELITFYEIDKHVAEDQKRLPQEFLDAFKNPNFGDYRNRLGHTIKLLVRDNDGFKDDLEKLKRTWDLGNRIFLDFGNPKVRYESPDPCDTS